MSTLIWEEKGLELNDGTIHYWVSRAQSDRTLVFLHGAGVDHDMFNDQYDFFSGKYNIVTWDARWHGKSKDGFKEFSTELLVSDLNSLLSIEKIEKCILVGQSMGGNLAQEYAFQFENKIEGLILIDCTKNIQKLSFVERILWATARPIFAMYPWSSLINAMAKACSVKPDVQEYLKKCFREIGKQRFVTILMELNNFLKEENLHKYPENILLICGEEDQSGNIKKVMAEWGGDLGKNFNLIRGASHNANQDKPEEVNEIIAEFIYPKLLEI